MFNWTVVMLAIVMSIMMTKIVILMVTVIIAVVMIEILSTMMIVMVMNILLIVTESTGYCDGDCNYFLALLYLASPF